MSTHQAIVRRVKMEEHPDADKLAVHQVNKHQTVVLRKEDWEDGELAVHIEPDFEVKADCPLFDFLPNPKGKEWIKVKPARLRGIQSWGFFVPLQLFLDEIGAADIGNDINEGDNVLEDFELDDIIRRYEPPAFDKGGERIGGPALYNMKYDIENYYKEFKDGRTYLDVYFDETDGVIVTEKIHGANGRFVFHDGKMFAGSRKEWKKEDPDNQWWKCLANNPWIEEFCRANPDHVVYGEVYGMVKNFRYDKSGDDLGFRVFDVAKAHLEDLDFMSFDTMWDELNGWTTSLRANWVPVLYYGKYNKEKILSLVDRPSTLGGPDHIQEGIVIKPTIEKRFPKSRLPHNRLQLKIVSDKYLEK